MRLVTPVLPTALCKSSRIRLRRILGLYAGFLFYQRLVPKLKNSAKQNSGTVCRFTAFAAFATGFCQRHCVFLCKGTKAAKSYAFCDSLPVFLWRDFGGFTKNNKVCVFYWGKICFFSFLSIFCLQEN